MDATMWPFVFEEPFPVRDNHFCLFKVQEQLAVQAVVPKSTMKALNPWVLTRTTRLDIHRLRTRLCVLSFFEEPLPTTRLFGPPGVPEGLP